MFLNFQKIGSSSLSQVLVKSEALMVLEPDTILSNGSYIQVTKVDVGYNQAGFYTPSTFDQITSVVRTLDVRTGFDPLASSSNLVYSTSTYPLIKVNKIVNLTLVSPETYIFNPSYLMNAETVYFTDVSSKQQETGLMISLHDSNPKRILIDMSYETLIAILGAVSVPH